MADKVVFITTTGSSSWTVPADFSSTNTILTIGGGGGAGGPLSGSNYAGGGGGGAFSQISNLTLTPGASVTVQVGTGGAHGAAGNSGTAGGDTWLNGASLAASSVGAKGGGFGNSSSTVPVGGTGGAAASGIGTTKFSGGNGGPSPTATNCGGGGGAAGLAGNGGAGAKGPHTQVSPGDGGGGGGGAGDATGAGSAGSTFTTSTGGNGGNNGSGTGAGAGSGSGNGSPGTNGGGGGGGRANATAGNGGAGGAGIGYTQTSDSAVAGPGGGAGSGGANPTNAIAGAGANGGLYGGGGSAAGFNNTTGLDAASGDGAQGIIIVIYTPAGTNVTPTGVSGTGSAGAFSVQLTQNITLTGVAGTGSAGTFSFVIGPQVALTGVQGNGTAGNFSVTASSNVTLTGVQGVGSAAPFKLGLSSLAITEFTVDKTFQRVGTTKNVPFSFTYTPAGADVTALEAQVDIVAGGTALAYVQCTSIVASNGSGTAVIPAVPQGAWYKHTLRDGSNHAVTSAQSTRQWGVGIVIYCDGQSQMGYMAHTRTTPGLTADSYVRYWNSDPNGTQSAAVHATNIGPGGSGDGPAGMNALGQALRAGLVAADPLSTVPILLFVGARSGTSILDHISGQPSWTAFTGANGTGNAAIGTDAEFYLWLQGDDDTQAADDPASYYATDLAAMYTQAQTLTGRNTSNLKMGVVIFGGQGGFNYSEVDAKVDIVRAAQIAQVAQTGCFYCGATLDAIQLSGDIHYTAANMARMGKRYAQAILKQLGLATYGAEGPAISSAFWPIGSNLLTVRVQQSSGGTTLLDGTGSASGSGLTGFVVTASGGQTVSSIALSAGKILITMSAVRAASQTVSLTYGAGKNPYGFADAGADNDNLVVYDNQSALIGDTTGFPLQPTAAAASVAESAGTGQGSLCFGGLGLQL